MFRHVVVLACVAAAIVESRSLDERIIGGKNASLGQFPYQVSLRNRTNGAHKCGGTIIDSRFIITAAHCIKKGTADDYYVVVGSISTISGGTTYTLENLVAHAKYDEQPGENDIAILKTSNVIEFSATVQVLPLQQDEVPAGSDLTLSGWGVSTWPNYVVENLQYITLHSIDKDQCASALQPIVIFDSQICTFNGIEEGACSGDSGGPLVYDGHLAGVVSWAINCTLGYPDVSTKVSSYISWIKLTMQSM